EAGEREREIGRGERFEADLDVLARGERGTIRLGGRTGVAPRGREMAFDHATCRLESGTSCGCTLRGFGQAHHRARVIVLVRVDARREDERECFEPSRAAASEDGARL